MPSADLANYWKCAVSNRPLPSSKNPRFQNEARCITFLVKMSFICMKMKNHFHIKGWAPTLVLKQRPRGTRKWPISLQPDRQSDNGPIMARIQILVHGWGPRTRILIGAVSKTDLTSPQLLKRRITQSLSLILIRWMEIYPVEGAI